MDKADCREELRNQLEDHFARVEENEEWPGNYWVEVDFETDAGTTTLQFQFGSFNITGLDEEEQFETTRELVEEEGLNIQTEVDVAITTTDETHDIDEVVRITGRILYEVYDAEFSDIEDIRELEF
ncbi:hypothetical protein PNP85_12405 [Halobacterium salinarum]|uniref:hypothetical protein n=1 Tax=Halobacterium salinarum TaxID=2242 RepID=UPI002556CBB2|nr:hypothetical protein [Halobacterium salinarum]MDL0140304.1 hypothetical protein [Halobacterium salinarum]